MSGQTETDAVRSFQDAATHYCSIIEAAEAMRRGQFVWSVGRSLAQLYCAACALPDVSPATDDVILSGTNGSIALAEALRRKLGDVDEYRRIFDPYDRNDGHFQSTLALDLAEVYTDVKEALAALASEPALDEVIWEVQFTFGHHWGIHAAAALYTIHWMTFTAGAEWVDPNE